MKRNNNSDLIRFYLASIVLLVHSYALSQNAALAPLVQHLSSDLAVQAVFVVSGFLIFQSYERSRSLADYTSKRVRRIYPAYAAVILLATITGALITSVPWQQYFSGELLRYLAANLVFLNFLAPTLPGVFADNAIPVVNGALWTLKIEVSFYVCVPAFAWLIRRFAVLPVVGVIYLESVAYVVTLTHFGEVTSEPGVILSRLLVEMGR